MAALSFDRTGIVVVADSQMTHLSASEPVLSETTKVAAGPHCVGALAGIVLLPHGNLMDALTSAVAVGASVAGAAHRFVTTAAEWTTATLPDVLAVIPEGDVVWEVVIAGDSSSKTPAHAKQVETGPGHPVERVAVVLTAWVRDGSVALHTDEFVARETPTALVIGARHPDLWPYDVRHHADHAGLVLAAQLTRQDAPSAPMVLASNEVVVEVLERAVASEQLADRPVWWPVGVPVSSAPVRMLHAQ